MSGIFKCVAGHVTRLRGEGSSTGFYYVPGLSSLKGPDGAVMIRGISHSPEANIARIDCLDGFKALVGLGSKFETVTISLSVFLGDQVNQHSSVWASVAKWFASNRISTGRAKPVFLSEGKSGKMATAVYVIGLRNSDPDDRNVMSVSIVCIGASPTPKG